MTDVNPQIRDTAEALNPQRNFIPVRAAPPRKPETGWLEQGGVWHEIRDGVSLCGSLRQNGRLMRPFLHGGSRPCPACQRASSGTKAPEPISGRDQAFRDLLESKQTPAAEPAAPDRWVLMRRVLGTGDSTYEEVDVYDDFTSARAGRKALRKCSDDRTLIQLMLRRPGQPDQPEGPQLFGSSGRERPDPDPAAPTPTLGAITRQFEQLLASEVQKAMNSRDSEIRDLRLEIGELKRTLTRLKDVLKES